MTAHAKLSASGSHRWAHCPGSVKAESGINDRKSAAADEGTAAHELGEFGINVNMLSGGLLQSTDASKATPDAVFDLIAASTPLRTVTTPEEFAAAIMMFLSPYSRAVTGQNLIVDGGLVKG